MENFLREAKNNAVNISTFGIGKVHAVLGSEACDLDSAVSTLVYAFLLHRINQKSDVIVIPVLNVSRKDFRLKTEVVYYLEENNINFTDLVFKNEIDLKALLNNGKLMLTLVDHNSLQKGDSCLHPAVEEIIDHHKKSIDNYSIRCSTTIEMVGSCATLVAEKLFGQDVELCDSQIANLLYGVMVLDTVCFDDSAGRVTEKDKMIARKLEQLLPNVNSRQIFDSLMEAKFDISDLSPEDVLRKDLKLVTNSAINIAVTSLPVLVDHFVTQVASVNDLGKLNAEYNFHILVLMGIHVQLESGEVNRQIGVYSINDTCKQQVADFLMNVPELQLELVDMNISCLTVFRQGNSAASRKVVLPLLSNFLLGDESSTDLLHSSMKMRYSEGSSSAREHRASANEEFNDFDPFESADQSVFTPPNGINVGSAAYFLGVGDPLSLPISSQNSSNQNSCPYTPQNSYADSDFDMDNYTKQLLPSFNSRDMMEKIEIKRGKLRGYEVEPTNENYPFTPKNSFVESTFDGYAAQLPAIDSNTLLQKLHDEKAHLEQSVGDQEEETEGRKKLNDSVSNGRGGQSVNGADERAGAEESSHSPDENSIASSHGDKTDEKMDISTSGSDKDPNSAPISDVDLKVTDKTDNIGNTTALGGFDGAVNAYQEEDLELAVNYQAETVDFPDSPHHMKLLANRTKEKLKNTSLDDDSTQDDEVFRTVLSSGSDDATKKERPTSFSKEKKKKIQVSPDILNDDDTRSLSSLSNRSVDILSPGVDDLATPDDIETPDELEDSVLECVVSNSEAIPELSAAEEYDEERSWRTCIIAGVQRKIDMKVIEPYKKVLSHGGYFPETHHAIILFSACNLPDRSRRDYDYVMDNLFLYVLTTLDQLVAEDYILIYLQGATERSGMPSFGWMKRCYQMIDRRLRKNLKGLYLVHPTFWLKTIVLMTKPFISSKFSRKLRFVANLQELSELIPMDHVCIPDKVKQYDEERQTVVT